MLRKKITRIFAASCAGILITSAAVTTPALAQNDNSAGFTVQAIIPDNQIDKNQSYFDLLMKPGQTQTLSVNIINTGNEEITIDVSLRAASTNRNGIIEYQVQVEPDETLKVPFDTIAETTSEIKVAANSTQKADIVVTMPDQEFDGVILGGINFTKRQENDGGNGVSVNNQFSYVVGVKLSENDTKILPDFRLKSIEPTLINFRRAVVVNIQNPVPLIIKNADVTANVYRKNETEPLFTVNKNGVDMAPNSVFPLPIEWGDTELDPGEYLLELKLTYQEKLQEWSQEFTIDSNQAQQVNSIALDRPVRTGWWATWWWIPLLILGVLLLLWIAFILGRRRREEEKKDFRNS